jgi:hypothetical protein
MHPIARTSGVSVKRLGDEAVLFDSSNGSVHHLNRVAEIVWRACDGRTDVDGLARIVARAMQVEDPRPAVELALEQLSRRGLLETPVERAGDERRRNRRDVLKQLAKVAAIPAIMTLSAGRARAQFITGELCYAVCPDGITLIAGFVDPWGFCVADLDLCPPVVIVVI